MSTTFIAHGPDTVMTPLHIGIVACSAEGAALCYRTICLEGATILGPHAHPEVTVHTHSLADYMACIYRSDWPGVGELMLASAQKLKAVGADFLICPDNTIHQALPQVVRRSPLPWLHIAVEVASEAVARGFKRLAITGTRWLVDSEVYPDALTAQGLAYRRPTPEERDEINRAQRGRSQQRPRRVAAWLGRRLAFCRRHFPRGDGY